MPNAHNPRGAGFAGTIHEEQVVPVFFFNMLQDITPDYGMGSVRGNGEIDYEGNPVMPGHRTSSAAGGAFWIPNCTIL